MVPKMMALGCYEQWFGVKRWQPGRCAFGGRRQADVDAGGTRVAIMSRGLYLRFLRVLDDVLSQRKE